MKDEKEIDNTAANDNKRQPWHITDSYYPGIALQQHFTSVLKESARILMFDQASGRVNAKAESPHALFIDSLAVVRK